MTYKKTYIFFYYLFLITYIGVTIMTIMTNMTIVLLSKNYKICLAFTSF